MLNEDATVMSQSLRIVQLSKQQWMYLKNSSFLDADEELIQALESVNVNNNSNYTLHVSSDIAEKFRDAFTERLAKVGFNEQYEPTAEGKMLEQLIDDFYEMSG